MSLSFTMDDGLGVLIISPIRELAYQTFEVLKKIGQFHDFSAGLIIGGKVNHYCLLLHRRFLLFISISGPER